MRQRRSKTSFSRQKIGLVLIFISLVCFGAFFSHKSNPPVPPEITKEVLSDFYPVKIIVPKVGINLPVSSKEIINGQWDIPATSAAYLLGSGIPGQAGNAVIYGHNKNKILGPIRWLKKGDEIKLINPKGQELVYQVAETKTVSVKNVNILLPSEDFLLTIYTCAGILDTQRFVVVAKLKV